MHKTESQYERLLYDIPAAGCDGEALLLFSTPTKFSKVLQWQRVKKTHGAPSSFFHIDVWKVTE